MKFSQQLEKAKLASRDSIRIGNTVAATTRKGPNHDRQTMRWCIEGLAGIRRICPKSAGT